MIALKARSRGPLLAGRAAKKIEWLAGWVDATLHDAASAQPRIGRGRDEIDTLWPRSIRNAWISSTHSICVRKANIII